MKTITRPLPLLAVLVAIFAASPASAMGRSSGATHHDRTMAAADSPKDIDRRLDQVETGQQVMEAQLKQQLQDLRMELAALKAGQVADNDTRDAP